MSDEVGLCWVRNRHHRIDVRLARGPQYGGQFHDARDDFMPRRWAARHAHRPSYMLGHECNGIFSSKCTAMVLADCIAVMGACGGGGGVLPPCNTTSPDWLLHDAEL